LTGLDATRIVGVVFLLLLGSTLAVFIGLNGFATIDHQVTVTNKQSYRLAVVMEGLQSLEASRTDLDVTEDTEPYGYDRRRSLIPVEYFTNRLSNGETGVGFKVRDNRCFIPQVSGLDGQSFGFYVQPLVDVDAKTGGDAKTIPETCSSAPNVAGETFSSPALLVREDHDNPPLLVRLYVYAVA